MTQQIGKLAVVVTSDTAGLDAGFNRAQTTVQRFALNTNRAGAATVNLSRSAQVASGAISAFRGNMLPLVGSLGTIGAGGGVAAGAAIGIGAFAAAAIRAREAQAQLRNENAQAVKEWEKIKTAAGGALANVAETTRLHASFVSALNSIAGAMENLREITTTKAIREQEEAYKLQLKTQEKLKKFAEARAAEEKRVAEAVERTRQAMESAARSFTQSLRTPEEIYGDTVAQLKELSRTKMITDETLKRGLDAQVKALRESVKAADDVRAKFHDMSYQPIAAAERFTAAGFSAAQAGRAELVKQIELQRQEIEVSKRIEAAVIEGNKIAERKRAVVFKEGRF